MCLLTVFEKWANSGPQKASMSPEELWIRGTVALWESPNYQKGQLCFFLLFSPSLFSSCLFWSPMFHFSANLVHSESERWEGGERKTKERKAQVMTQQRESPSLRSTRRSTCTQGSPRLPSLCPALHSSVAFSPCFFSSSQEGWGVFKGSVEFSHPSMPFSSRRALYILIR